MDKLRILVIDRSADDTDVTDVLMSGNYGGVVQEGRVIEGSPYPLATYPSNYRTVAFHKVWIVIEDVVPEVKNNTAEFLLNLGYRVNYLINQFVHTKIQVACVIDYERRFEFDDCYRFELKFDTDNVSGNLTKEAFENAIFEFRSKTVAT